PEDQTPDAPTITGLVPGNQSLSATYSAAPETTYAIASYQYKLDIKEGTEGSWTAITGALPTDEQTATLTLTGLTNGTTYVLTIRAIDSEGGEGDPSNSVSDTPRIATPPGAPSITGVTAADQSLEVTFEAAESGDYPVVAYEYKVDVVGGAEGAWTALAPELKQIGGELTAVLVTGMGYPVDAKVGEAKFKSFNAAALTQVVLNHDTSTGRTDWIAKFPVGDQLALQQGDGYLAGTVTESAVGGQNGRGKNFKLAETFGLGAAFVGGDTVQMGHLVPSPAFSGGAGLPRTFSITGLEIGTEYAVTIRAVDAQGNAGTPSAQVTETLPVACDAVTDWTAPANTMGYFCSVGLDDYAYADFHILTTDGTDVCAARATYLPTGENSNKGLFCAQEGNTVRAIYNWNNSSRNKELTWLTSVEQIGSRTEADVACGGAGKTVAGRCAKQIANAIRAFPRNGGSGRSRHC
ncbi:MAG: hypothetical protein EBY45_15055, partial [Gammaproteobacteria bacterium]|nr:hypothetical protein [Gammaproteobacteria bacterium]